MNTTILNGIVFCFVLFYFFAKLVSSFLIRACFLHVPCFKSTAEGQWLRAGGVVSRQQEHRKLTKFRKSVSAKIHSNLNTLTFNIFLWKIVRLVSQQSLCYSCFIYSFQCSQNTFIRTRKNNKAL